MYFFFQVTLDDARENLLKVGTTFFYNEDKITLRFRFERKTFNWELKGIEYENLGSNVMLVPKQPITALKDVSYFSEGPVIFSKDGIVLKFKNKFQVSFIFN